MIWCQFESVFLARPLEDRNKNTTTDETNDIIGIEERFLTQTYIMNDLRYQNEIP